jgi:hypothetical protein
MKRSNVAQGPPKRVPSRFGDIPVLFLASAMIWWSIAAAHLRIEKCVSSGASISFKPFWVSTQQKPKATDADKTADAKKSGSPHERCVVHGFSSYAERSAGTQVPFDASVQSLLPDPVWPKLAVAGAEVRQKRGKDAEKSVFFFYFFSVRAPPAI